jgi:hypothetical protein
MNAQFETVHDKLQSIEEQTIKTNSRVNRLEDKVASIDKALLEHPIKCEKGPKIDEIKADLEDYRVFKKYPKLFVLAIAVMVIGLLLSFYSAVGIIGSKKSTERVEQKQDTIQNMIRGEQYIPPAFRVDTTGGN